MGWISDIGGKIEDAVKSAGRSIDDTIHSAGSAFDDNVIKPVIEQGKDVADQLGKAALEGATGLVTNLINPMGILSDGLGTAKDVLTGTGFKRIPARETSHSAVANVNPVNPELRNVRMEQPRSVPQDPGISMPIFLTALKLTLKILNVLNVVKIIQRRKNNGKTKQR